MRIQGKQLEVTLAEVLAIGNTTGSNDIVVSTGQQIIGAAELTIASAAGAISLNSTGGAIEVLAPAAEYIWIGASSSQAHTVYIGDQFGASYVGLFAGSQGLEFATTGGNAIFTLAGTPSTGFQVNSNASVELFGSTGLNFLATGGNATLAANASGATLALQAPTGASIINVGTTGSPTINIGNGTTSMGFNSPTSIGTDSGGTGLIQVKKGFTSIGDGSVAAGMTFGPIYYDSKNGTYVQFGNSVYIDGANQVVRSGDGADVHSVYSAEIAADNTTFDVSTLGAIDADPLLAGSVVVRIILNGGATFTSVTDDGAGNFASGAVFPSGGTVDYVNRTLTGTTAGLEKNSRVEVLFVNSNTVGEALTVRAGDRNGTAVGGDLTLRSGAGSTSGDLIVDVGAGSSTNGTITVGGTNAESVTIGRSTKTTNIAGYFTVGTQPVPVILSVTSVDLATVGTTNLYTVPTGRSLIVTDVFLKATTATSANGDASGGVGVAAGEDDIVASQTLTGLNATTETFRMIHGGIFYTAVAADVVKFGVDIADTGTALVADVYLVGYLI